MEHVVRESDVCPLVKLVAAHVLHDAAPAELYCWSFPHGVQLDCPAGLYDPAGHGVTVLPPLQELPAGQSSHLVRVVDVPPDVKLPGGQMAQLLCASALAYCHEHYVQTHGRKISGQGCPLE